MMAVASPALATKEPRPQKLDHRVRTVMYQPDQVFKFTGHYRFQSSIEFAPDEEISTISMGDSTGWMINPSGNRLFLKPVEQDATTNMTLITNKHTYLFELHAAEAGSIDDENMVFIIRFIYPGEDTAATVKNYLDAVPLPDLDKNPGKYNFNYTISGPARIAPLRIFDDGEFTYFEFKDKNADIPAFFLVDSLGNEAVINFRTRGNFIVVERVASRYTLRHGNDIVCIFNEAKPLPPAPAEAK
jgi:type IV secretion system protein VirB9